MTDSERLPPQPPHGQPVAHDVTPLLVGRVREQRALRELCAAAVAGQGALTLVSGEAGIGKTTLVNDLMRDARRAGVLTLAGSCYDVAIPTPYGPWLDAFDDASRAGLPDRPIPWRAAVSTGVTSQTELFQQAHDFLAASAATTPLIVTLEDLHWADAASLELLRFVARSIRRARVLLVATYRADEVARGHALYRLVPELVREAGAIRLQLRPLDDAAQRAWIAARYRLSSADEDRLAAYLATHAEGHPFFAAELLRTLEEEALLTPHAGGWTVGDLQQAPTPTLVGQVIDARVDRLGGPAGELLGVAAVIGQDVPLELWSAVADVADETLLPVIERVVAARMLREQPDGAGYGFCHALVRDALYAAVPLPQRRALHRRIAELLAAAARPEPDQVAQHFGRAGDSRAATWLLRAGEQALERFAPRAALESLTAALTTPEALDPHEHWRAWRGRGRARETIGEQEAALADLTRALETAEANADSQSTWQSLLDLGEAWAARDYTRTGAYYAMALILARDMNDAVTLATSLNHVGNWQLNSGQTLAALTSHQEALATVRETGDRRALAQTLDLLGITYSTLADAEACRASFAEAAALCERLGDRRGLSNALAMRSMSASAFEINAPAGTYPEAVRDAERAEQLAREIGWRAGEIFAATFRGRGLASVGEIAAAETLLQSCVANAAEIEHRQWLVCSQWTFGLVQLHSHDVAAAAGRLSEAHALAHELNSGFLTGMITPHLAVARLLTGDRDGAQATLDERFGSLDLAAPIVDLIAATERWARATLAQARGDPELALACVESLYATLPHARGRWGIPHLALLRGRILSALDRPAEAWHELAASRASTRALSDRLTLLPICVELERTGYQLGRAAEAAEAAREARELAAYLVARLPQDRPVEERAARTRAFGVDNVAPTSVPAQAGGLTARETEVLRLVAQGLTDAEVAERLFISPRTVGNHLSSIYAKLDVATRTAAARVALKRGLT